MIFGLFGKKNNNRAIVEQQYQLLTQAGRQPAFYQDFNVPDTVMGRFEMIASVMILYFRRTANSARTGQEIAQEIIDAFFEDLDHSIRELGIGDLSVPKKMKRLAGMFYGRLESYADALKARDEAALAAALARNFHPEAADVPDMSRLARYMIETEAALASISEIVIEAGQLQLPAPAQGLPA